METENTYEHWHKQFGGGKKESWPCHLETGQEREHLLLLQRAWVQYTAPEPLHSSGGSNASSDLFRYQSHMWHTYIQAKIHKSLFLKAAHFVRMLILHLCCDTSVRTVSSRSPGEQRGVPQHSPHWWQVPAVLTFRPTRHPPPRLSTSEQGTERPYAPSWLGQPRVHTAATTPAPPASLEAQ